MVIQMEQFKVCIANYNILKCIQFHIFFISNHHHSLIEVRRFKDDFKLGLKSRYSFNMHGHDSNPLPLGRKYVFYFQLYAYNTKVVLQ